MSINEAPHEESLSYMCFRKRKNMAHETLFYTDISLYVEELRKRLSEDDTFTLKLKELLKEFVQQNQKGECRRKRKTLP